MRRPRVGPNVAVAGLVVANLVPLVGVVGFGWRLGTVMVVYWLESAVVGAEAVAKILAAGGEDDPNELPDMELNGTAVVSLIGDSKSNIAKRFVGHYGFFWIVHGFFVMVMFAGIAADPVAVAVTLAGMAAYHAVSYRLNYIGEGEYERTGPVTQLVEPYRRVLVLHVTIVFSGFPIILLGAPVSALALMVVLKTVLDFRGHWKEHDRARRRTPPTTAE